MARRVARASSFSSSLAIRAGGPGCPRGAAIFVSVRRKAEAALVIFARAPQLGRVKTRLVPPLTARQALAFHIACLESTARLAASLSRTIDTWLYLTPAKSARLRLRLPFSIRSARQRGADLGKRLEKAFAQRSRGGAARVVVIGSDSPALSRSLLLRGFAALSRAPAVLGPAHDGGFYLIGLRVRAQKIKSLLDGVEWGGPRAFRQVRAHLQTAGLRVALLPRLYDVDTADDLVRLRNNLRRNRQHHLRPLRDWFRGVGPD